jgi:ADP-ribose pyrophosphatase
MHEYGPWKVLGSKQVYRDPWIEVQVDDVIRPDGRPGTHSIIRIKSGATVIALDETQHVYLTEEFHYGVGRVTIEGVSGGNEPPEDSLATARRELQEEIGIVADRWTEMGVVDPFTANVHSPTRLYLAEELRLVDATREGTETMHRLRVPLAEAVRMVWDGRITHSPTCVALLKVWMLKGGTSPEVSAANPRGSKTHPGA